MAEDWSGCVLTGGRSTRMGRDKALLSIDGVAMAVRVARALTEAGATEVRCVGGDLSALRSLGLDAVPDEHDDAGPLAGILTAIDASSTPLVVVAPCDLIAPAPPTFAALVTALRAGPALAAVPIVDDRWRPLPVALRREARAAMGDAFTAGERAVHRAIERLRFVAVDVGPVLDADAPGDLPGRR